MNLPNSLTIARLFLIPLLVVVLLTRFPNKEFIAVAIFLAASFTDWADGYMARRRGQVTTLGTWLDPVADKLLVASAFIALVEMGLAPAWMVVILVGRELAVTGLRNVALAKRISIHVSDMGKLKMVTQVFAITSLILGTQFYLLELAGLLALWLALFLAILSALQYFRQFWAQVGIPEKVVYREPVLGLGKQAEGDVPTQH
ncbi:MAG: CDP-diacylglycerol--glycerol-3-phosphate 3-phosphatidyltransferase [Acidobacteria bacterium]|nr:CDP-diacylglycerol--glycerol-3-phosphate 3-phosphatidyltransferase [Acidobacteriota bacterium]